MRYIQASETGLVRSENQDYIACFKKPNGVFLALLADGIGGAKAGSLASKMTVELIMKKFRKTKQVQTIAQAEKWFRDALSTVNHDVFRKSNSSRRYQGMGTTLVALFICGKEALAFSVGDSRVYTFKNQELTAQSIDDTFAQEMYRADKISLEELKNHPKSNVLMKAVGIHKEIDYQVIHLGSDWDQILLSSDGLHSYVEHDKIEKILLEKKLEEKKDLLMMEAFASGAYDNISFILIEGEEDE